MTSVRRVRQSGAISDETGRVLNLRGLSGAIKRLQRNLPRIEFSLRVERPNKEHEPSPLVCANSGRRMKL